MYSILSDSRHFELAVTFKVNKKRDGSIPVVRAYSQIVKHASAYADSDIKVRDTGYIDRCVIVTFDVYGMNLHKNSIVRPLLSKLELAFADASDYADLTDAFTHDVWKRRSNAVSQRIDDHYESERALIDLCY